MKLPRPGDISRVIRGGPWGLYRTIPGRDDEDVSNTYVGAEDGLLLVIAAVGEWRFVLTSTERLGWVYEWDIGVDRIAGSVYSTRS